MATPGDVPVVAPATAEEAAAALRDATAGGRRVRFRGGGTKLGWGAATPPPDLVVSTGRLDRVLEHNAGDLTAVLQAGVPLARAQEEIGRAGQMIALDPPLGAGGAATVGGVVATGDSGPLRSRYGSPRDLVVGVTVVLGDGSVAKAGGKVIKNVAGYDLPKLLAGSFGTLGLVVELVVRLHPRPVRTVTAAGGAADPEILSRAAIALAHSPFAPDCLDVWWAGGRGGLLARFSGAAPDVAAGRAADLMAATGLEPRRGDDGAGGWERQRAGQRAAGDGDAVVRVSGLPVDLAPVLRAVDACGGSLVGRAGLGLSWIRLPGGDPGALVDRIEELRRLLRPFPGVVLDAPPAVRGKLDVWGGGDALPLMRRVKARFDPAGVCNPGLFVGGI